MLATPPIWLELMLPVTAKVPLAGLYLSALARRV
jgi:hypothetical protein